jgi:homoserine kinase
MGSSRVGALAAPVRLRSENRGAAAQVDDGIASGKIMRYDYAILYNHFVTPQLLEIYIIVEYQLTLSNKIPQDRGLNSHGSQAVGLVEQLDNLVAPKKVVDLGISEWPFFWV